MTLEELKKDYNIISIMDLGETFTVNSLTKALDDAKWRYNINEVGIVNVPVKTPNNNREIYIAREKYNECKYKAFIVND